MAGKSLYKIKHNSHNCQSSGKPLQVFLNDDGTLSGYCFSCRVPVENPLGDNAVPPPDVKEKTEEEILAELQEIKSAPYFTSEHRKIPAEDLKHAGVRLLVSEFDGKTPYAAAFPYTKDGKIVRFKITTLSKPKRMWSVGATDVDLFNWERAKRVGGKTLFITEGEWDAISLRTVLRESNKGTQHADIDFAVVSIPNGVSSAAKAVSRQLEEIYQRFQDIVLCFDTDEAGQKAAAEVIKIAPKAMIALLPCKDANACLEQGRIKATRDAVIFRAAKKTTAGINHIADLIDEALAPVEYGASYPWAALTELTYGQRRGELISIGAGTGIGKSLLAHEIAAHNAKEHNWKTFVVMMEETNAETIRNLCGKIDSIPYHIPGVEYDKDTFRETALSLNDNIILWNPDSRTDAEGTFQGIMNVIRKLGDEIDCVIIDNLTTLSEGMQASERNDFIGEVASKLVDAAMKFEFQAIVFSHLNPPDRSSKSHEEGGKVLESQFTGSRALQRYSHLMVGFVRNKFAIEPNCSYISVLKNRKYGVTGMLKTFYLSTTGRLVQRVWDDEMFASKKIDTKEKKGS